MNKKIITALMCVHLLITPTVHAWQLPGNLDNKKIGLIAGITAVMAVLIGLTCYTYKKRGLAQPVMPAVDLQRQITVLQQELQALRTMQAQSKVAVEDRQGASAVPLAERNEVPAEVLQEMQSKNDQVFALHTTEIDRTKIKVAECGLEVCALSKKLAEVLEKSKENERAINALRRFTHAGFEKIKPAERRGRLPVKIKIESDEPEVTQLALVLNQEVTEPIAESVRAAEKSTVDKLQAQEKEQNQAILLRQGGGAAELQPALTRRALLLGQRKKPKVKEQEQPVLFSTTSCQATIPDGRVHGDSEMGLEVQSPFHGSHPLAEVVSVAVPVPLKPGQDFASLSLQSKAQYGPPPSMPLVHEGLEIGDTTAFGRSLTEAQAEQVQAMTSATLPVSGAVDLHALSKDLDEMTAEQ